MVMTALLTVQSGMCAEVVSPELKQALKMPTYEPNFLSIAGALIFVICLIYVTGLIYTKLNVVGAQTVKKQLKNLDLSCVRILSTTQLGQGRNLHVIEVNNKHLLIGSTNESVNLIKDLDENEAPKPVASFNEKKVECCEIAEVEEEDFGLYKKYLK